MAHWQLKNREEGRRWYDKAVPWIEQHDPDNEQLMRFQRETQKLLGSEIRLPKKQTAGEELSSPDFGSAPGLSRQSARECENGGRSVPAGRRPIMG